MDKTLYLKAGKGDISPYVIFSGDPIRVGKIITFMDDIREVGISREFHTYTGVYKGVEMTISSTGIGGPSAAIAIEEMYACGMKVAVRLGTVMGLKDDLLGNFIIPAGAMRADGTSKTYVDTAYPAVADIDVLQSMNRSAGKHGFGFDNGLVCSYDGFYSQMRETALTDQIGIDVKKLLTDLRKINISGVDMESATILTLCRLMGIRGCVVTMTTVLENLKEYLKGNDRKQAEEMDLVKVVLDGVVDFHGSFGDKL